MKSELFDCGFRIADCGLLAHSAKGIEHSVKKIRRRGQMKEDRLYIELTRPRID